MYETLKDEITVILDIVNKCPENMRQQCFDILLHSYLEDSQKVKSAPAKEPKEKIVEQEKIVASTITETSGGEEIKPSLFHTAIRRMLDSNSVTMEDLNALYYYEEEKIKPLYEHMKTSLTSDSQVRLALLTAFEEGFADNDMTAEVEVVRERCKVFKCYDGSNFTAIFKRNKQFFDGLEENAMKTYRLSIDGKKELCSVLRDLAKGE